MSLQTDIIFAKALRSNADLMAQLPAGDVYNTAIALPDEDADNAKVPYIIVSYDGLNNQDSTKDSSFDGLTDMVTVGIEIAAKTRPQLAELAIMVRDTIRDYFRQHVTLRDDEDYELIPNSYQLQAQQVQYDSLKPCYWQQLAYQCDTDPD
jgi:hypothetical protein